MELDTRSLDVQFDEAGVSYRLRPYINAKFDTVKARQKFLQNMKKTESKVLRLLYDNDDIDNATGWLGKDIKNENIFALLERSMDAVYNGRPDLVYPENFLQNKKKIITAAHLKEMRESSAVDLVYYLEGIIASAGPVCNLNLSQFIGDDAYPSESMMGGACIDLMRGASEDRRVSFDDLEIEFADGTTNQKNVVFSTEDVKLEFIEDKPDAKQCIVGINPTVLNVVTALVEPVDIFERIDNSILICESMMNSFNQRVIMNKLYEHDYSSTEKELPYHSVFSLLHVETLRDRGDIEDHLRDIRKYCDSTTSVLVVMPNPLTFQRLAEVMIERKVNRMEYMGYEIVMGGNMRELVDNTDDDAYVDYAIYFHNAFVKGGCVPTPLCIGEAFEDGDLCLVNAQPLLAYLGRKPGFNFLDLFAVFELIAGVGRGVSSTTRLASLYGLAKQGGGMLDFGNDDLDYVVLQDVFNFKDIIVVGYVTQRSVTNILFSNVPKVNDLNMVVVGMRLVFCSEWKDLIYSFYNGMNDGCLLVVYDLCERDLVNPVCTVSIIKDFLEDMGFVFLYQFESKDEGAKTKEYLIMRCVRS